MEYRPQKDRVVGSEYHPGSEERYQERKPSANAKRSGVEIVSGRADRADLNRFAVSLPVESRKAAVVVSSEAPNSNPKSAQGHGVIPVSPLLRGACMACSCRYQAHKGLAKHREGQ